MTWQWAWHSLYLGYLIQWGSPDINCAGLRYLTFVVNEYASIVAYWLTWLILGKARPKILPQGLRPKPTPHSVSTSWTGHRPQRMAANRLDSAVGQCQNRSCFWLIRSTTCRCWVAMRSDLAASTVSVIVILSVRLSVCLSHSWTVSTWFDLRSWFLHHRVAPSF